MKIRAIALLGAGVVGFSGSLLGLEPASPDAVADWIKAFQTDGDKLRTLSTPGLMVALAHSPRLGEVTEFLGKKLEEGEKPIGRFDHALQMINASLGRLAVEGHQKEAALVDRALMADAPRLVFAGRELLDAAARLAAAGENDALLRLSETMLLIPGCDRREDHADGPDGRDVEVPRIDRGFVARPILVLSLLKEAGQLKRFRESAGKQLAKLPDDFRTLQVLTLATLLDEGDSPELWDRIARRAPSQSGSRTEFVRSGAEFTFQLRIAAPHFCARAEQLIRSAARVDVVFNPHERADLRLLLATLWKDAQRLDEARKVHGEILESLDNQEKIKSILYGRLLEEEYGMLVESLNDPGLLDVLDRWIDRIVEAGKSEFELHDDALQACAYALSIEAPRPILERWFRLADSALANRVNPAYGNAQIRHEPFQRHLALLIDAGMIGEAQKWQTRITEALKHVGSTDLNPTVTRGWLENATSDREPLVWRDSGQELAGTFRWQLPTDGRKRSIRAGGPFPPLSPSSLQFRKRSGGREAHPSAGTGFIADLFASALEDRAAGVEFFDGLSPGGRLGVRVPLRRAGPFFKVPRPGGKSGPWLRAVFESAEGEFRFMEPQPIPPHPNLLPDRWMVCGEFGPVCRMLELKEDREEIRLFRRGGNFGGYKTRLLSPLIPIEKDVEYIFSGRTKSHASRAGVRVEFIGEGDAIISSEALTEYLAYRSPGQRFFRTILGNSREMADLMIPPGTQSLRVVLHTSLEVQARWADLSFSRFSPEAPKPPAPPAESRLDDDAKLFLEFDDTVSALAVTPGRQDRLAVALQDSSQVLVHDLDDLENPTRYQLPEGNYIRWVGLTDEGTLAVLAVKHNRQDRELFVFRPGMELRVLALPPKFYGLTLAEDGNWVAWRIPDARTSSKSTIVVHPLHAKGGGPVQREMVHESGITAMQIPLPNQLVLRGYDWRQIVPLPELKAGKITPSEDLLSRHRFRGLKEFAGDPGKFSAGGDPAPFFAIHDVVGHRVIHYGNRLVSTEFQTGRAVGSADLTERLTLAILANTDAKPGRELLIVRGGNPKQICLIPHDALRAGNLVSETK